MNVLEISKPQHWRKRKNNEPQCLLRLTKKHISFVNNKQQIYNCTHHFKNTLTSCSETNFRIDIFHSKTLLYSFWGRENGLKANKICKIFSHLNICLHYHVFIRLQIAYEHINFVPASCASVKCTQLLVKLCLIYQYQQVQL